MHETTKRLYQAALEIHNQSGQSAVARLLNESPQTVKNWESRGVSKQGAIKIEQQLGVRASWLLTGHGPMHTQTQVALIDLDNNPDYPAIRRVRFALSAGAHGYGVEYEEEPAAPPGRFFTPAPRYVDT